MQKWEHVDYIKSESKEQKSIVGKDTIADILTLICNADMNRKRIVQIPLTNITENIVKILLREGFVENVRKHRERESNK